MIKMDPVDRIPQDVETLPLRTEKIKASEVLKFRDEF